MESGQPSAPIPCAHRWQIASPTGAYSKGICTKCHEERLFANSPETISYGYGRTRPRGAVGSRE
jgi:hypothetical protein